MKNYTLRLEEETLDKLRYMAKYHHNSINGYLLNLFFDDFRRFELENGKVSQEDIDKYKEKKK